MDENSCNFYLWIEKYPDIMWTSNYDKILSLSDSWKSGKTSFVLSKRMIHPHLTFGKNLPLFTANMIIFSLHIFSFFSLFHSLSFLNHSVFFSHIITFIYKNKYHVYCLCLCLRLSLSHT